jgi:hypothetical protein
VLLAALRAGAIHATALADQAAKPQDSDKAKAKSAEGMAVFQSSSAAPVILFNRRDRQEGSRGGDGEDRKRGRRTYPGIGLEKKADWISLFLQKKEKLEDTLHPKKFPRNGHRVEEAGSMA